MTVYCPDCLDLQHMALAASKAYHCLLEDLEAAHICHNSEVLMLLSTRLRKALQERDAAIDKMKNHEHTHAHKKPAEVLPMRMRQSA